MSVVVRFGSITRCNVAAVRKAWFIDSVIEVIFYLDQKPITLTGSVEINIPSIVISRAHCRSAQRQESAISFKY